jgi:hypothetical protein
MGWHINEVKNEVVITKELAKELFDTLGRWDFGDPVTENDILDYGVAFTDSDGSLKLYFNSDDMEHMDYIWEDEAQEILKKHKVKGDICFSSDDGDNAGESWGYRFDGNGGMVRLTAERKWVEVVEKPKKAKKAKKAQKKAEAAAVEATTPVAAPAAPAVK